ncbi:unnamed protein product, partial [Mesorhabditis spiculigera]
MEDEEDFDDVEDLDGMVLDIDDSPYRFSNDIEERYKSRLKDENLMVDPAFAAFHFAPKKGPPKKLVIKRKGGAKPAPTKEETFETNWSRLANSIEAIQNQRGVSSTLEHLYRNVDSLCTLGCAAETYEKLDAMIKTYLHAQCEEIKSQEATHGLPMLIALNGLWERYCQQLDAILSIFTVLDRNFLLHDRNKQTLNELGLHTFHLIVLDHYGFGSRVGGVLVEQITLERQREQVDTSMLRSCLRMLSTLAVYPQLFENQFILGTIDFYREEGERLVGEMEAHEYVQHTINRINEEKARLDGYLFPSTRLPLFAALETQMIQQRMDVFVKKGTAGLLENRAFDQLAQMYELLAYVPTGLLLLKAEFSEWIKKYGRAMVNDPERDETMVKDLMIFKEQMDRCITESFQSDEKFTQAEKDAFDFFINTRPVKPAELIAKFMDARLRAGNKESNEEELDLTMHKAMQIFRFIQGKDVFEAFYKKDLAKRLLLGRSASVDAEKAMLQKLRQECGAGFTHKLEGMFKDMDLSAGLITAFRQYASAHNIPLKPDLGVHVLTMGSWPKYEPKELVVPHELAESLKYFNDFYVQNHNGRKLNWQHSLGQALLKANFSPGAKELQVSLYQATILLLFNSKPTWKYEEILEGTKLEGKELMRTLQSLACAKHKVLQKTPKGREVNEGDVFEVNDEFATSFYRIRISQVQMKETPQEKKEVEEEVSQDRQYQIDAALVRIMKTRKRLSHQQLLQEIFAQLRFSVKATDVKDRVASLLERDYMTRDTNDSTIYHYVA